MPEPFDAPVVTAIAVAALALFGGLIWALWSRGRFAARAQHWQRRCETTELALAAAQTHGSELASGIAELQIAVGDQREQRARLEARIESMELQLRSQTERERTSVTALETRVQQQELAMRERGESLAQASAQLQALQRDLQSRDRLLAEQKAWIEEQNQALQQRMQNLTTQLLEEKSRKFTETNREQLDLIVRPFKEQLQEFRARVDTIYQNDSSDRSQLREQIRGLTELNRTVSQQAEDLTKALTVTSKSTGNWGEMILRRLLEDSGLREGHEYRLQVSVSSAEDDSGNRGRQQPDAVIYLPDDRQVIVDAKTSNRAWTDYVACEDAQQRDAHFREHLQSLRAHIRGLAQANYPQSPDLGGAVDFVLMFIPVESALLEALGRDPSLYGEAYRQKIILVVPSTLLAVIRLIEGMWTVQRQSENARHIAEAGAKLHDKLVNFCESFVAIDDALKRVADRYETARRQLSTGPGNAVRLARQMQELGIKSLKGKNLPASLLDASSDADDDPA